MRPRHRQKPQTVIIHNTIIYIAQNENYNNMRSYRHINNIVKIRIVLETYKTSVHHDNVISGAGHCKMITIIRGHFFVVR